MEGANRAATAVAAAIAALAALLLAAGPASANSGASEAAPLPSGRWAKVTVPLDYEGHLYRRGSRIRVTISAPGGDQPVWAFAQAKPAGSARVKLAHSPKMRSRLVLPVVPGVGAPTGLPPCPGLRGEPCRDYSRLANREVGLGGRADRN